MFEDTMRFTAGPLAPPRTPDNRTTEPTELNPWQAKVEALPAECEPAIEAAADSLPFDLEITDPEGFSREIYRLVMGEEG
jgi:hypothetical protein